MLPRLLAAVSKMGDRGVSLSIVSLFEGVVVPSVSIAEDSRPEDTGILAINDDFSVRVGGGPRIYSIFRDLDAFSALPVILRKGILDTLYLILRRGTHDVVRFRCHEKIGEEKGIIYLLLDMLALYARDRSHLSLTKRVIRLLGIVCIPSIQPAELKRFLKFLRSPSLISNSLLHALKTMIRQDDSIVKSAPASFFNFGGAGSGLHARQAFDFFRAEFQVCMWFRIETFRRPGEDDDAESEQDFLSCFNESDHRAGIRVFTRRKRICVEMQEVQGSTEVLESENLQLRKGVWYHLCVTHSKARYALFNRSKITIRVDGAVCFDHFIGLQESSVAKLASAKSPMKASLGDGHIGIGLNFDGQIGAVYYFLDPLPPEAIEVVSRINAMKPVEGYAVNVSIDLLPIAFVSDGKQVSLVPNILAVYHPSRVTNGLALDVHGGRHAVLGPLTYAWHMQSAREVLMSLGGVRCLLPLFPRLLIENDLVRSQVALESDSTGLGSSLGDIYVDPDCFSYLGENALEILSIDKIEVSDEGCIGLLLSIISRCVMNHDQYLHDLALYYGIGMIEYALSNVSSKILSAEGDTCAVALLELKQVVSGNSLLENSAIKHLLSNFKVWSKASVFFQKSLISILHSAVSDQPEYFIRTVGVHWFLDQVLYFVPTTQPTKDADVPQVVIPESLQKSPMSKRSRRFGSINITVASVEGADSVSHENCKCCQLSVTCLIRF